MPSHNKSRFYCSFMQVCLDLLTYSFEDLICSNFMLSLRFFRSTSITSLAYLSYSLTIEYYRLNWKASPESFYMKYAVW